MKDKRKNIVPKLLLETKADIPFVEAQLQIYQPSIREISYMGEQNFFTAITSLTKNYQALLLNQDNFNSEEISNFEILMSIISEKIESSKLVFSAILQLFGLIFPGYKIIFIPRSILLQKEDNQEEQPHIIDRNNFDIFSQIIYETFGVAGLGNVEKDYNPAGDRARAIAEKLRKRNEIIAKKRGQNDSDTFSLFGRYIEILAVGEQKDKNDLAQYSPYQIMEEFQRFQLKQTFDYTMQAKMAGGSNIKDAKDWMSEISLGEDIDDGSDKQSQQLIYS